MSSSRFRAQVADARTRVLKFKGESRAVQTYIVSYLLFFLILALGKTILEKKNILTLLIWVSEWTETKSLHLTRQTMQADKQSATNLPADSL